MGPEQLAEKIQKRLDVIILLLLESTSGGANSFTRKIERLLEFGLSKSEVAQIIGKSVSYVSAVTTGKKKTQRKQRGKK